MRIKVMDKIDKVLGEGWFDINRVGNYGKDDDDGASANDGTDDDANILSHKKAQTNDIELLVPPKDI